jgi:hypothetical protein
VAFWVAITRLSLPLGHGPALRLGGADPLKQRWRHRHREPLAYEDTADYGIMVGQTSGDHCPTDAPAPSTLALLAAGAFGIRRWRARRAAV